MPTVIAEGTQAATVGTTHTLVTDTSNRTYVLAVAAGALADGDELELQLSTKILTGSPSQMAYYAVYSNTQLEPNKYSIPVPADIEIVAKLKQLAGTARSFAWKLLAV